MSLKEKVNNWLSNFSSKSSIEIKDLIEFRQSKVELLKSEISTLIDEIDTNDSTYFEMIKSTKEQIEKGMKDGESLSLHLEDRYSTRNKELLKSLGIKKMELRRHEEAVTKLINTDLEKAQQPQHYSDSIVCNSQGNILMLLRKNDDTFEPNKWGLPGGKVESLEDPEVAAVRELKEETNLDSENTTKIGEKTLKDGGKICYYSVNIKQDTGWIGLDNDEHSNYCFMSIEEIRTRPSSDFIMELKDTLLELLDPMNIHYKVIEKAHTSGEIDNNTFTKVTKSYYSFNFKSNN